VIACTSPSGDSFSFRKNRGGRGVRGILFLSKLFYFFAVLDLVDKNLSGLKAWNKVLIDNQGSIARNIAGNLLLSLLIDKASESTNVDVVSVRHRTLYHAEKCFYGCCYISLVNSGLFSDLVNNICFGHCIVILVKTFREGKFSLLSQIKK
jgi:hypothetical protein